MIIDNYIGFLLVLTAESQEEFFKGYRLAKAGNHPGRTWKDVNKKSYTRNNYKKKRGTK